MIQCHTIRLPFHNDNKNCRKAKLFLPWHFIVQSVNRYKASFKEKANLLFQSAESQYFIFKILAFFCDAIKYFNINFYNEKRFNLNYGLFKR